MFKRLSILLGISLILILLPSPVLANDMDFMDGFALGAGFSQGTENAADESFAFSIKTQGHRWQYGVDFCMSEDRGGIGDNNFAFLWAAWTEEFQRPEWQDYGIYAGAGAGFLLLSDDLTEWPVGPFVMLGWDLSSQAGLEGKVGWFGEEMWGTAMFYWYFE